MNGRFRAGQCRTIAVRSAAALVAGVALMLAGANAQEAAASHDYPTYERVRYVLECIEHNGADPALVYQCSCAIDKLAERFTIDDFVEMQTALNGSSIAGERGGVLRDNPALRVDARHYREAEGAALKACGVRSKH